MTFCMNIMVHLEETKPQDFNGMGIDHRNTLKLAQTELLLWTEAHASLTHKVIQPTEAVVGRHCHP